MFFRNIDYNASNYTEYLPPTHTFNISSIYNVVSEIAILLLTTNNLFPLCKLPLFLTPQY